MEKKYKMKWKLGFIGVHRDDYAYYRLRFPAWLRHEVPQIDFEMELVIIWALVLRWFFVGNRGIYIPVEYILICPA